jgi:hypothetical protein
MGVSVPLEYDCFNWGFIFIFASIEEQQGKRAKKLRAKIGLT